jgi:hypothetical protein
MSKVVVPLLNEEREAIVNLALVELRTPSAQAHYLLRGILRQLKLLPFESEPQKLDGKDFRQSNMEEE